MKETIEVQRGWLESLVRIVKEAEKALDEWSDIEDGALERLDAFPSTKVHHLIGFASSAETLLNLNK